VLEDLERAASDPAVDECDIACDAMPGMLIGDLSARDREWILEHTLECNYCRNILIQYEKVESVLDQCCTQPVTDIRISHPFTAEYGEVESPLGPLMVAQTAAGVCEIGFGKHETEQEFLYHLRTRGFRPVPNQNAITTVARQLSEYFEGERNRFEVPLDVSGVSPFTRSVLTATSAVPFGGLSTYRGIADKIGQPSATRAVGNALGRNPLPVVIPCHRIVRSDSSLGGYTGGPGIKERLLALEGVMLQTA